MTAQTAPVAPARREFDHETAFDTVAVPLASKPAVQMHLDLFQAVRREEGTITQDRQLECSTSASAELRARFAAAASADPLSLAIAARVIYFLGHHGYQYSPHAAVWGASFVGPSGATWKFSHMADEALTVAIGLNPETRRKCHPGFIVIEGMLRHCEENRNPSGGYWMNCNVCAPVPDALAAARAYLRTQYPTDMAKVDHYPLAYRKMEAFQAGLIAACAQFIPAEYADIFNFPARCYTDDVNWWTKRQDARRAEAKAFREASNGCD